MGRTCASKFFLQRTHPIHPIGPSTHVLGAFRIVLLVHECRYKIGRTGSINAQVHATKLSRICSQRKHPMHPAGP
jgi:hypothetical protein